MGGLAKALVGFQPLPRTFVYMLFSRLLPFCLTIMRNKKRSIDENEKKGGERGKGRTGEQKRLSARERDNVSEMKWRRMEIERSQRSEVHGGVRQCSRRKRAAAISGDRGSDREANSNYKDRRRLRGEKKRRGEREPR